MDLLWNLGWEFHYRCHCYCCNCDNYEVDVIRAEMLWRARLFLMGRMVMSCSTRLWRYSRLSFTIVSEGDQQSIWTLLPSFHLLEILTSKVMVYAVPGKFLSLPLPPLWRSWILKMVVSFPGSLTWCAFFFHCYVQLSGLLLELSYSTEIVNF